MGDKTKENTSQFMAGVIAARQTIVRGTLCPNVSSKCLLLYYCVNANRQGKFFKSTLDIILETGLTEKTIRKYNALWKQWGLLSVTEHDWRSGKANDYEINLATLEEVSRRTLALKTDKKDIAKRKAADRAKRYREKLKKELDASHPGITVVTPERNDHHTPA